MLHKNHTIELKSFAGKAIYPAQLKAELLDTKTDNTILNQLYGGEKLQGDKYMDKLIEDEKDHYLATPECGILVAGLCERRKSADITSKDGALVTLIKANLSYAIDHGLVVNIDEGDKLANSVNKTLINLVEAHRKTISQKTITHFINNFDQKNARAIIAKKTRSFDGKLDDRDEAFMAKEKETDLYKQVSSFTTEITNVCKEAEKLLGTVPSADKIYHPSAKAIMDIIVDSKEFAQRVARFNTHLVTSYINSVSAEIQPGNQKARQVIDLVGETTKKYQVLHNLVDDSIKLLGTYKQGKEPNVQRVIMMENLINKLNYILKQSAITHPEELSKDLMGILKGIEFDIVKHHEARNFISRKLELANSNLYKGVTEILKKYSKLAQQSGRQSLNLGSSTELRSYLGVLVKEPKQSGKGIAPGERPPALIDYRIVPYQPDAKEPENPDHLLDSLAPIKMKM